MAPLGTIVVFTVVALFCWYKWGQTVPAGTSALITGVLSRNGRSRNDDWFGGILQIPLFITRKEYFGWTNTFRLDCSKLGKPPTGPVVRSKSWKGYLRPMKQTKPATCAIVSCTVTVEAMHRKVYEDMHSADRKKFPDYCKAAEGWIDQLRRACERKGIWKPGEGAKVGDVLKKIKELGGVRATLEEGLMPLRDWKEHNVLRRKDVVAALIDQGPCIGRLWVCPWYTCFNATNNNDDAAWVYRGCGRDQGLRDECKKLYNGQMMGSHAVVCSGYRILANGEMHVLVLDNHDDNGPERWIDVQEFDAIFTVEVGCLIEPSRRNDQGSFFLLPN